MNKGKSCHILIVEDNNDTRNLISDILRIHGHVVHSAADGEQALVMARQHNYDIIFMDLMLPKKNGLETSELILKEKPKQKIIVLSACLSRANVKKLKAMGIQRNIPKPFRISEVFKAINEEMRAV